jgi:hypothetical protein
MSRHDGEVTYVFGQEIQQRLYHCDVILQSFEHQVLYMARCRAMAKGRRGGRGLLHNNRSYIRCNRSILITSSSEQESRSADYQRTGLLHNPPNSRIFFGLSLV